MKHRLFVGLIGGLYLGSLPWVVAQTVTVTTLTNLDASGGVTTDAQGTLYISDFGPQLGNPQESTSVYLWDAKAGAFEEFASGFQGASGACFDAEGNFYQANPFGGSISKVYPDGTADHRWWTTDLQTPIGLEADAQGNLYVCNCAGATIGRISAEGYSVFAESDLFQCPNGLTQDEEGILYACNFNDGKVLRIDTEGQVSEVVELPVLTGGANPVGNGHLIYSKGWLYVTAIGRGEIYRVAPDGSSYELVAGKAFGFANEDGVAQDATFSKPNGIAASITGDTLYVNVSEPIWPQDPTALHPARVRMVIGVCSIPNSHCQP